ncbi:nucleotidyl transferase AbiEii/AbiGii toxin family protein [Odoribacter sp. Z80]|uniref:nucleotidyl transferase AbiEii/AbiGii toxin family protein n=1 Tax=Odoribacter sp. Z80 TaxID=2304575 RepID=UPI00137B935C|nr:nucleotidyl transferase AbiEii/AbiGii toxin family protein [Odoribacter sp. Z80]NCE73238.1 nucleotidyl transferase AbiEii/AbiGii toxin family protein [Odoribacter sp. Z80]
MEFYKLTDEQRRLIFRQTSAQTGINANLIEKDWWVCVVLRSLYSLPYSKYLSFKGGTSLSKCWHLIDRFSEDIDIAIDREFLGFGGTLSKTQISDRLRRAACSFVRETLQNELRDAILNYGLSADMFNVNVNITPITTTDPEVIEVVYPSLFEINPYIKNAVKIEISGRSMSEPVAESKVCSIIDETYPTAAFISPPFKIRAVLPERTFLEKIFLLHEEFAKMKELIRTERMSRHIYDIGQILKTPIGERAINDEQLYRQVIEHRRTFIGLRGFDYNTLYPTTLSIIPPVEIIEYWKADYENMCLHMIYGNSVSFDDLIERLRELNEKIKKLDYSL